MAKTKYYAVRKGRKAGIYMTWDECKAQVTGFSGAEYKSFSDESEALAFLGKETKKSASDGPYAFVDGSYDNHSKVYGYGGFLFHDGKREVLQGSGSDAEMASMRNVSGEILGSMAAISKAVELGLKEVTIYYDYMGIEKWANGEWKRNKKGTIAYYEFIREFEKKIQIYFVKVKGHSGVEGNEEADRLAKEAVAKRL